MKADSQVSGVDEGLPVRGPRKGSRSVGGKHEKVSLGRAELEKPIGCPDGGIQGQVGQSLELRSGVCPEDGACRVINTWNSDSSPRGS